MVVLIATGNWRQLNLAWQAVLNATSYSYYYNIKGQTNIYTGSATTISAVITNLTDDIYEVYVVAFDAGKKVLAKSNLAEVTLLADTSKPTAPITALILVQPAVYGATIAWYISSMSGQWASGVNYYRLTITDNNGLSFTRDTELNSYILTDLNPSLLYSASVTAISKAGVSSDPSNSTAFACLAGLDITPPGTISNFVGGPPLSAVPLGGAIQLGWSAASDPTGAGITSSGIASYTVEYGQGTTTIGTIPNSFSGMTITGLTNGSTYWFKVRAIDVAGNPGEWSNAISAVPLVKDIAAPPTPEFTAVSGNGAVHVFIVPVEDTTITGYHTSVGIQYVVRYYNALAPGTIFTAITSVTWQALPTLNVSGTAPMNMLLYVTVAARDANGNESLQSAPVVVSSQIPGTGPDTTAPSKIMHVTTTPLDNGLIVYSKDRPIDVTNVNEVCSGIDHYDYRWSSDLGASFSYLNNQQYDDATITGLTNGTTYTVQVRAVDAAGNEAPWSSVATGTPSLPPPPSNFNVTYDGRTAVATWTPINSDMYSQFIGYRIITRISPNGLPVITHIDKADSSCTINITPGLSYKFTIYSRVSVSPFNIEGQNIIKTAPLVADITAPSIPDITSIISNNQGFDVAWSTSTNIETTGELATNLLGYEVEYKVMVPPAANFISLGLVSSPTTTKSITALQNGVLYGTRIRSVDDAGNKSAWSTVATVIPRTTDSTSPVPLTNITVTPSHEALALSWNASQDPINPAQQTGSVFGYKVFCSSTNGIVPTKILGSSATSCVFDNLTNGVQYTIYIQVSDSNGNSNESQNVLGTPIFVADTTPPYIPSLTATAVSGQITLTWNPVTDQDIVGQFVSGIDEYDIQVSLDDGVSYTMAAPYIPHATTTKVIAGLTNGTKYTYQIRARDNSGNYSSWSSKVSATPTNVTTQQPAAICFLSRAPVLTPSGFRPISLLRVGDRVRTADGRIVTIKRTLRKEYSPSAQVNPYIIPKGLYGAKLDLEISPNHEIKTEKGMIKAKHLGLMQMNMSAPFTYYNIELEDWATDNLVVGGVEAESLAPVERISVPCKTFAADVQRLYKGLALARHLSLCYREDDHIITPPLKNVNKAAQRKA